MKDFFSRKRVIILIAILILGASVVGFWVYQKKKHSESQRQQTTKAITASDFTKIDTLIQRAYEQVKNLDPKFYWIDKDDIYFINSDTEEEELDKLFDGDNKFVMQKYIHQRMLYSKFQQRIYLLN